MATIEQRLTALEAAKRGIVQSAKADYSKLTDEELRTLRSLWLKIESFPKINGKLDLSALTDEELAVMTAIEEKVEGRKNGND